MTKQGTFAGDMAEMMACWAKIEAAAKEQFPNDTDEERYQRCKGAMLYALGKR